MTVIQLFQNEKIPKTVSCKKLDGDNATFLLIS